MSKQKIIKVALEAILIMGLAFIGFNIAFILYAFFVNTMIDLLPVDMMSTSMSYFRIVGMLLLFALVAVSFKLKLPTSVYAAIFAVAFMVFLVMIGITLYPTNQWIVLAVGGLVMVAALLFCWIKKLPWQYSFAIIYDAILGFIIVVARIDI